MANSLSLILLRRSVWRENHGAEAIFSRVTRCGLRSLKSYQRKDKGGNDFGPYWRINSLEVALYGQTAIGPGRMDVTTGQGYLASGTTAFTAAACKPSGWKVIVRTSPYFPSEGSFLPLKKTSSAPMLPAFTTISVFPCRTFS
jgi:hypothetical protein